MIKIWCGDCLKLMPKIESHSVNLIVADLPYGVTQNPNDKLINLNQIWYEYKRIIKTDGIIALTTQYPFTTKLIQSSTIPIRYDLIWDKYYTVGFLNSRIMPLRVHESILIFYNELGTYNPIMTNGKMHLRGHNSKDVNRNYGNYIPLPLHTSNEYYPDSIISIKRIFAKALHPTEKPIELAEWLIKTYSNENDLVIDNTMGTGWTAIASKRLNRNYIGIDINPTYIKIAMNRVNSTQATIVV